MKARKMKFSNILFLIFLFISPIVVLAADFAGIVSFFVYMIVNPVVYLIVGFAVVYFLWGVAKYILHSDDAKSREEGRSMMIYGIIAIFVMISMWGLVNLLDATFGLENDTLPSASDFLP